MLDRLQYGLREVLEHYDEPHWYRNRIEQRIIRPFHLGVHPGRAGSIHVMEKSWDNLIVLDACRWDLFEKVVDTTKFDQYWTVDSLGSGTGEWTQQNFAGGSFGDTVYVTSNPHTSQIAGDSFHRLYECWRDNFDDDSGTVHPEPVVEAARTAIESHPNKRLVVHFMQPHHPFVRREETQYGGWQRDYEGSEGDWKRPIHVWDALEMGLIDRETVWEAYADNLEYVMPHVERLVDELPGRSVITSDHGNFLGERVWPVPIRLYGHTTGVRHPAVNRVPWGIVNDEEAREVINDGVNPVTERADKVTKQRLKQLGYLE